MIMKILKKLLDAVLDNLIGLLVGAVLGAGFSAQFLEIPLWLTISLALSVLVLTTAALFMLFPLLRNYWEAFLSPTIWNDFKNSIRDYEDYKSRLGTSDENAIEVFNKRYRATRERLRRIVLLNQEAIYRLYRSDRATKAHILGYNKLSEVINPASVFDWNTSVRRNTGNELDCFDDAFLFIQTECNLLKRKK